eukprot:8808997-Prorocentrum_lima.AAC.1
MPKSTSWMPKLLTSAAVTPNPKELVIEIYLDQPQPGTAEPLQTPWLGTRASSQTTVDETGT